MLKGFRQHQDGTTAVEFALIAPLLFSMIFGIIEISLIIFAQNALENATFVASRIGKTGYVEDGETREETIRSALENRAGAMMDVTQLQITTESYPEFGDVGSPEPYVDANGNAVRDEGENYTDVNGNGTYDEDMGVSGSGSAGEVVVYTVSYPWHLFGNWIGEYFGTSQTVNLTARTVVVNEPY